MFFYHKSGFDEKVHGPTRQYEGKEKFYSISNLKIHIKSNVNLGR